MLYFEPNDPSAGYFKYLNLLREILIIVNPKFSFIEDIRLATTFKSFLCLFTQNIDNPFICMRVLDYILFSHPITVFVILAVVNLVLF
jgi:hypothetical protein